MQEKLSLEVPKHMGALQTILASPIQLHLEVIMGRNSLAREVVAPEWQRYSVLKTTNGSAIHSMDASTFLTHTI